jgi:hypothetical protein
MLRSSWRYLISVVGLYLFSVVALWFIYSMGTDVASGIYRLSEARILVLRMAAITSALSAFGVAMSALLAKPATALRSGIRNGAAAGIVLGLYTVLNVAWREAMVTQQTRQVEYTISTLMGYR